MRNNEIAEMIDSLPEQMKKEFLAFIQFLKDTEDNGEPRPASRETGSL